MSPCLEDCPTEIVEAISILLDLTDIQSLRQSCKSLATKIAHGHFKSYYRSKRIDLTLHALRAFVSATQAGRLGCLVEELVLVGLVNLAEEQNTGSNPELHLATAKAELDLLSKAFNALTASKKSREFISLSLEVEVVQDKLRLLPAAVTGEGWKCVWRRAAWTFHITVDALAASRLPLEQLNVFNSHQSQSCSLACEELSRAVFQDQGLATSFASLKSLSISLSDRIIENLPAFDFSQPVKEKDIREAESKATAKSNFVGVATFLELACSLDSLEIHFYWLNTAHFYLRNPYTPNEHLLKQAAKSKNLPKLKQCKLRGIYISDKDLLAFIQHTATRRLFLQNVAITSGKFRPVFDYCTGKATGLEELHFDYLLEKHHVLYFPTPSQVGQITGSGKSTTSLQRVGDEVKHPIIYHYHQGRSQDTPRTRALQLQQRKEYGPRYR